MSRGEPYRRLQVVVVYALPSIEERKARSRYMLFNDVLAGRTEPSRWFDLYIGVRESLSDTQTDFAPCLEQMVISVSTLQGRRARARMHGSLAWLGETGLTRRPTITDPCTPQRYAHATHAYIYQSYLPPPH